MRHDPTPIAAAIPAHPLEPQELVTDDFLRRMARGDPARQRGEISEADQAELAMILPDLCGELLAYRLAARRNPPFPAPRNHAEEIAAARLAEMGDIDMERTTSIRRLLDALTDHRGA